MAVASAAEAADATAAVAAFAAAAVAALSSLLQSYPVQWGLVHWTSMDTGAVFLSLQRLLVLLLAILIAQEGLVRMPGLGPRGQVYRSSSQFCCSCVAVQF